MQQVQTALRKRGSRASGLLHELHQGGVLTHLFIPKERVHQALQIRAHGCQEIPVGLQPVLDVLTKGVPGCEQLSFKGEPLRVLHIRDISPQMCEVGCQDQGIGAIGGHRNSKGNTLKQKEDPEKPPKSALQRDHEAGTHSVYPPPAPNILGMDGACGDAVYKTNVNASPILIRAPNKTWD